MPAQFCPEQIVLFVSASSKREVWIDMIVFFKQERF